MPRIRANGLELEYDTFGERGARPLLLVMGLGAQMILWDEEFCDALAERGHFVVRFDNRDVGLSTKLDHAGVPDVLALLQRARSGEPLEVPYTLDHMADDAAALLDALAFETAHVCGASMGGMIAQTLAYRHPARLRSLTSIMSSTGNPELPQASPEAMGVLLAPPPTSREEAVESSVKAWLVTGSPGFPGEEDRIRERAGRAFDRSFHPAGAARQLAAILGHGSRKPRLAAVSAPTLVIHGSADPLVPLAGGRDTAEAIPGAELVVIEGMGHDLPTGAWPRIVEAIAAHTARAEESERG
jgi:pimeloyl-ACP methyl ester carboxylesterase